MCLTSKLQKSPRLAQKVLEIGDRATVHSALEYAGKMANSQEDSLLPLVPDHGSLGALSSLHDSDEFLGMIPKLTWAIESSSFGEQHYRIKKRIALAHFFYLYELAQENSQTFLAWCNQEQTMGLSPKGSQRSMVTQSFANLMFSRGEAAAKDCQKTRIGKIQAWRKSGKPWARLIAAFGYGILLLVPQSLTDEEYVQRPCSLSFVHKSSIFFPNTPSISLRQARDDEIAAIIELIQARQTRLGSVLRTLNGSFDALFGGQGFLPTSPPAVCALNSWKELLLPH